MSAQFFITILMAGVSMIIGTVCFLKNKKSLMNIFYFLSICSLVLWMGALDLGYYFIDRPLWSLAFIRLTFGFGALGSACICAFTYFYPRKVFTIPDYIKILYMIITGGIIVVSSFTDLVYEKEIIINSLEIQDVHGPAHSIFILYYFLNLFLATTFLLYKVRITERIERIKIRLVLWGIVSMVIPTLIFHMILPRWGIYFLQTGVIYFNFIFIGLVGYSMLKYRFLDVRFTITRIVKQGFSVLFTVLFVSGIWGLMQLSPFLMEYQIVLMPMMYVLAIFMYFYILRGFVSDLFHIFFGLTSVEHFHESLDIFTKQSTLYSTVEEFNAALKDLCKSVHIESVNIIPLNTRNQEKYASFVHYFEENPEIFVQDECPFLSNKKRNIPKGLTSAGDICIPLFRSPKVVLGFLVIGKKQFHDLYSTEEIRVLKEFKHFLELRMVGILYSDFLKREVEKKTESLCQKNKELKELNEKLHVLDEAKDTFLSIASHELRTPMTVISGFADLLLADGFGDLNKKQKIFLGNISQSSKDLTNFVNQMLDINILTADKMELKCSDISFPQVLEDMKQEFEVICQKKDLNFEFYNPCNLTITIWNDAFQLQRILRNLIGNSVKFTPAGGTITLHLEQGKQQPECVKVSVIDTGIGIPKEDQEMIFEKFHRTKHSEKVICSGTGLGLNIVKLLVEKLGGEIFVKSEKDKGACFTFLLPDYPKG